VDGAGAGLVQYCDTPFDRLSYIDGPKMTKRRSVESTSEASSRNGSDGKPALVNNLLPRYSGAS